MISAKICLIPLPLASPFSRNRKRLCREKGEPNGYIRTIIDTYFSVYTPAVLIISAKICLIPLPLASPFSRNRKRLYREKEEPNGYIRTIIDKYFSVYTPAVLIISAKICLIPLPLASPFSPNRKKLYREKEEPTGSVKPISDANAYFNF
jgi:hypothetical protein